MAECRCGSGLDMRWMNDCQGIPLTQVCDDCQKIKMKKYNPWVFNGYDQAFLDEHSGESIEPDVDIEPTRQQRLDQWTELQDKYGTGE